MKRIHAALLRVLALFVDDWPTTAALAAWLLVAASWLPKVHGVFGGGALFAGIAVVLIASVAVAARRLPR